MTRWIFSLASLLLALTLLAEQGMAAADSPAKTSKKPAAARGKKAAEKDAETPPKPTANDAAADAKDVKKDAKDEKKEDKKDAQPALKDAGSDSAAKPATYKVKKAPFRIEVTLDGLLEAQKMTEIFVRPQEWTLLSVLKAVEHGTPVKQGDLILSLDTEKIDRAINDLRTELQLGELTFKQAEQQLQAAEKTAPLDFESAQRSARATEEDLKQYLDVDKPLAVKTNEFNLQVAKDMVEYDEEELRQLEKMYKADDLTEETEAIVLKRARDNLKRAKFMLERAQVMYDEGVKHTLPRFEEKIKDSAQRAAIDWNRNKISLPLSLSRFRLEFERQKVQRAQSEERLNKLLADRAAMTVKAPADGIVYYGKCVRGKWVANSMSADVLRRGAAVMPNDIVMTVVQPRPLFVRATLPESQLPYVHVGQKATAEPTGLNNLKLTAVVQRISAVPVSSGNFDIQFTLALDSQAAALMPGMACEMKLLAYKKADALTVPPKAVFSEDNDPQKQFVYLLAKGDKPEKRPVTVGKRTDKQVEILEGLSEGDQVLLERPKDQ